MFPHHMSLLELCMSCRLVAVLDECCPSGRDSSLDLFVLGFVAGAVSLSQAEVAFTVHDLSVADIHLCVGFHNQTLIVTFIT